MKFRSIAAISVAALMLVGATTADVTVVADAPSGPFERGSSFNVTTDITFHCVEEGADEAVYAVTIANKADFDWIEASETNVTYDPLACTPSLDGFVMTVEDVEINVTIGVGAPAFEPVELQPGIVGVENAGGNFTIDIEYDPAFSVPNTLSFDSVAGGGIASIPLTVAANADSVFSFEVTSFTFDGEEIPEGAAADIQQNLSVDSPLTAGELAETHNVELLFTAPQETDADAAEDAHFHWETAEVVLEVVLAADADDTQVSEPKEVRITFLNTDEETMPHEDGNGGDGNGTDDGFFKKLPGYEAVAVVATVGMLAVLARRRD